MPINLLVSPRLGILDRPPVQVGAFITVISLLLAQMRECVYGAL
jgi:hypothetical protein